MSIRRRRHYRNHKCGFTLIEMLFSFTICLIIVLSITPIFRVISISRDNIIYNEDIYIAAKQISEYMLGSYYISLDDSYTYISRDDKKTTLYYSNDKLIKTPGYEVLLTNIEDVSFEIIDSLLYMNVYRDEKDYRFLISYVQEKDNENEQ